MRAHTLGPRVQLFPSTPTPDISLQLKDQLAKARQEAASGLSARASEEVSGYFLLLFSERKMNSKTKTASLTPKQAMTKDWCVHLAAIDGASEQKSVLERKFKELTANMGRYEKE